MNILGNCTDKESWAAAWGFGGLIVYNCCGGLYFFWLMCAVACGAGTEKVKTQVKKGKKGAKQPASA